MATSYYASAIQKSAMLDSDEYLLACGSFKNICIDGRYSLEHAKEVARAILVKEMGEAYCGFVIERCGRAWDYYMPHRVDCGDRVIALW